MKKVIRASLGKYPGTTPDYPEPGMAGKWYFGKDQAEAFGDMIAEKLAGQTVSKRKDLAEEPGGLIYEADELGINMWELLEALEGMCYQGRAREIDDSTYKVIDSPAQMERFKRLQGE